MVDGASNIGRVILGRLKMVTVCEIYVEPGIVCIPSAGSSINSQLAVEMLHSNTAIVGLNKRELSDL